MVIFDPPQETPQKSPFWPLLATFGIPWNFICGHFLTTFWIPKKDPLIPSIPKNPQKPQKRPFSTPPRPPPKSKNPGKWPFWRKPGFSSKIWTAKRGGVGVYPGTPKKGLFWPFWPFLTIFGHFWPFLAIFDVHPQNPPFWGHFLIPQNSQIWPPECEWKCEQKWQILAKKGEKTPPETPLARQTISNNRVIRPQIWNLRRKSRIFAQVRECEWFCGLSPLLLK